MSDNSYKRDMRDVSQNLLKIIDDRDKRIAELEDALKKAAQLADCERWPDRFPIVSNDMRKALWGKP